MPDLHDHHPDLANTRATTTTHDHKRAGRLDDAHWRAAAEDAVRLAARYWQVPLDNITEIALAEVDGPCYLFKVLYTDRHGRRRTAAVRMPQHVTYTSPLCMTSMLGQRQACRTP